VSDEFDLGGLWPAVGLCAKWIRPPGAFGRRSACADRGGVSCVGGGRRLARKRPGRPISIGVKAFGRRSACAPN